MKMPSDTLRKSAISGLETATSAARKASGGEMTQEFVALLSVDSSILTVGAAVCERLDRLIELLELSTTDGHALYEN